MLEEISLAKLYEELFFLRVVAKPSTLIAVVEKRYDEKVSGV